MNKQATKAALEALLRTAGVYESGDIALAAPEVQAVVNYLADRLGDERRRVADLATEILVRTTPRQGYADAEGIVDAAGVAAEHAFRALAEIDSVVVGLLENSVYAEAEAQRPRLLRELEAARQDAFAAKQQRDVECEKRKTVEKHLNEIMVVRGKELRAGEFLYNYEEVGA